MCLSACALECDNFAVLQYEASTPKSMWPITAFILDQLNPIQIMECYEQCRRVARQALTAIFGKKCIGCIGSTDNPRYATRLNGVPAQKIVIFTVNSQQSAVRSPRHEKPQINMPCVFCTPRAAFVLACPTEMG